MKQAEEQPHDLAAEQAILGGLMFDNGGVILVGALRAEHFYDPVHGRVFSTIMDLIGENRLADASTVRHRFIELDRMGDIGGAGYLLTLLGNAARLSVHMRDYAALIIDLAMRRRMMVLGAKLAAAQSYGAGADATLTDIERELADISQWGDTGENWRPIGEVAREAVAAAERGEATGISTGIPALDECTGGLRRGTVWVIGGASSMGKSVVGKSIAHVVGAQGFAVACVDLEMQALDVGLRASSAGAWRMHASDNPHYLSALRRSLSAAQWTRMKAAAADLGKLPVYIDARGGQTLTQIEARSRRLFERVRRRGQNPAVLLIDHQGLIASERAFPNELERSKDRANRTLALAKSLDVTVIVLAQLTKEGSRQDGEQRLPTKDDLDFGSEWDRAADVIMLIHRRAFYAERKPAHLRSDEDFEALQSREATLIVDKSRSGKREHVPVLLDVKSAIMAQDDGPDRVKGRGV